MLRHRPAVQECNECQNHEKDNGTRHRRNREQTFCMRFLLSPTFKVLILAVAGVVPLWGILIALPGILDKRGCADFLQRVRHYVFSSWVAIQFLYNFAMAQFTDPGGCKHIKPKYEATGQFEMVLGSSGTTDTLLYAPNFCEHCQHGNLHVLIIVAFAGVVFYEWIITVPSLGIVLACAIMGTLS